MGNLIEKMARVQGLKKGGGVQFLLDEAYKILGNPLVVFNMEYELLFSTKHVVTDDWIWNEIVDTGVFSEETIRFFLEECFIDDVANTNSIAFLISDKLKYERLYGRIFNGYNNTVADLTMVACNKPFAPDDPVVFEAVCGKISQEISTSAFYNHYGILYHEALIGKLLDVRIDNKMIYSGHLSNLYEDMEANLYVVVVDIHTREAKKKTLTQCRGFLKERHPAFKYAVYSNYLVIIAGTRRATLHIKRDLYALCEYANDHTVSVGVSSQFENLYNLRPYYDEAVKALKPMHKGAGDRRTAPNRTAE